MGLSICSIVSSFYVLSSRPGTVTMTTFSRSPCPSPILPSLGKLKEMWRANWIGHCKMCDHWDGSIHNLYPTSALILVWCKSNFDEYTLKNNAWEDLQNLKDCWNLVEGHFESWHTCSMDHAIQILTNTMTSSSPDKIAYQLVKPMTIIHTGAWTSAHDALF